MSVWRALLCGGLALVPGGCTHLSNEPTVRTKGGDSATLRIQVLIAKDQLRDAEALLLQSIAAGLLSGEAATRMREAIRQRRQGPRQQPGPERSPPVVPREAPETEDSSGERRTCGKELPNHPVCRELPEGYAYHSVYQALDAMKQRLSVKSLALHKPADTETGPCPFLGLHYNVRREGERAGSIVCCPCCVEAEAGPITWTRCRIVW